jgi:hypothetical protein
VIVSHSGRFFVATPTKTGTHSLEAIASRPVNREKLQLADATPGDSRRRMHRMAPDPSWLGYQGHLLVRNPWSRWVSVYEYLRAPKFYAQWGARVVQGTDWGGKDPEVRKTLGPPMTFADFLTWMRTQRAEHYTLAALRRRGPANLSTAYRSPWVWLDSLAVSRELLNINLNGVGPARLLHLEHLAEELPSLFPDDMELDLHVDQLNRTADPTHPHWTDYWTSETKRLATRLNIDQEAHDLGYKRSPE